MLQFDFVINDNLFGKIKILTEQNNKGLSEIIREVINTMLPFLKKKHLTEDRRKRDYPCVNATKRVRVFLEERVYNELKQIHDTLNTFSIAVLVREILKLYFDLIEKYGVDGFKKRLEKVKNKIEDMRARKVKWYKDKDERIHPDIPFYIDQEVYYYLVFGTDFCLKQIQFL
ncbi:MAG TPA: hypothetical protein PLE45_03470 [Spirochaetota bacterium]|nr:hypothetical protein [Spirochaetota bacterium]HPP03678.1 hypothetical protein [Spirochaetota bacterium]